MTTEQSADSPLHQTDCLVEIGDSARLQSLVGHLDEHLKLLAQRFGVNIFTRDGGILVEGSPPDTALVRRILLELDELCQQGFLITRGDIETVLRVCSEDREASLRSVLLDSIIITGKSRDVSPKSVNQKIYVDNIAKHDIVFAIGPAGTGKTYLAMAMALSALLDRRVNRIILTRPAVEAGERLGFLPGDIADKVDPYLRPLYDALYDLLDLHRAQKMVERGAIEIAPLAFMRGRTLNDCVVILDEAQNTTSEQMKMFLTRLGYGSKAVITGDITQVDLPPGRVSGLIEVQDILRQVPGISFVYFNEKDVVRHPLVSAVIRAYDVFERQFGRRGAAREAAASENHQGSPPRPSGAAV